MNFPGPTKINRRGERFGPGFKMHFGFTFIEGRLDVNAGAVFSFGTKFVLLWNMPVAKGSPRPEYTQEQKKEIVERVCALYESQQATVESCCDAVGISRQSFNLWCAQFGEFGERYKKAKEIQEAEYWENVIKPLQKKALQRHLEVEVSEDETEVVYQGVKTTDPETNEPVMQRSKKWILPNPSVLIFSMKGTYPDKFAERQEVKHSGDLNLGMVAQSAAKIKDFLKSLDDGNGDG